MLLFRHFYVLVIGYIYLTRIVKFIIEVCVSSYRFQFTYSFNFQYFLYFNYQWVSELIVELSTLFFFVMVGSKFRPAKSNPYLRLAQDDSDDVESAMAYVLCFLWALSENGKLAFLIRKSHSRSLSSIINKSEIGTLSSSYLIFLFCV